MNLWFVFLASSALVSTAALSEALVSALPLAPLSGCPAVLGSEEGPVPCVSDPVATGGLVFGGRLPGGCVVDDWMTSSLRPESQARREARSIQE